LIQVSNKNTISLFIPKPNTFIHRGAGGVLCLSNVNPPLLKIKTRVCTIVYKIHRHLVAQVMIVVITLNHDIYKKNKE
jgi:hypothetical protein